MPTRQSSGRLVRLVGTRMRPANVPIGIAATRCRQALVKEPDCPGEADQKVVEHLKEALRSHHQMGPSPAIGRCIVHLARFFHLR